MAVNYKFGPKVVMNGVAVSSTTAYNSDAISMGMNTLASCHVIWTGTPTGTLTVQGSNDIPASPGADPTHWKTLAVTGITSPSGSASSEIIGVGPGLNAVNNACEWIRFVYTNASGSGTMTMTAIAKGI